VLHFHGFNTTIDQTVPAHLYREHVYASGANVVLVVPQGPVNMASGDFGRLMDPAGTQAMLDEVLIVLYRAGMIENPVLGPVTLTSHSGGYQAVAANLTNPPFVVRQVDLFDSLYGDIATYQAYATGGGVLRSDYTASGGTDANNMSFASAIGAATDPTQANLRDAPAVVYYVPTTHELSTREVGAYGEQLRWSEHASRRGPRIELRSVVAAGGTATVTWLAPHDDDFPQVKIQTSADGTTWNDAATASLDADHASFPLTAGARVRVVPVLDFYTDPNPSDTYRVDPDAQILVVDGFDRVLDGSWGGLAHDFAAIVGEAAGAPVATISHRAITDDNFELSAYRTVIWLCGDQSTADHTFTSAEQAAVTAYLAGGGHLVISGSEVGYEMSSVNPSWLASTAGAAFASDNSGSYSVSGAGVSATYAGPNAPYPEEYPDTFTATGSGAVVLSYATGAAAAVGIAGRAVIVGFPLELVDTDAARAQVVQALIAFAS
jgi:hypothetical protein